MRIPRLYEPAAHAPDTEVELNAAAARHVVKVLRLAPGAPLVLFDGRGHAFSARLENVKPVRARVENEIDSAVESPLKITLLQALSRGSKMDFVVQKAVELGVARIVPVLTERSVMRLDARASDKKRRHWEKVAISACEQCGRNRIPIVEAPRSLPDALAVDTGATRILLDPEAPAGLQAAGAPSPEIMLLIGPEGGFSPSERQAAVAQGYAPVRLGPRVLRTETAALAALTILQSRWGDL